MVLAEIWPVKLLVSMQDNAENDQDPLLHFVLRSLVTCTITLHKTFFWVLLAGIREEMGQCWSVNRIQTLAFVNSDLLAYLIPCLVYNRKSFLYGRRHRSGSIQSPLWVALGDFQIRLSPDLFSFNYKDTENFRFRSIESANLDPKTQGIGISGGISKQIDPRLLAGAIYIVIINLEKQFSFN